MISYDEKENASLLNTIMFGRRGSLSPDACGMYAIRAIISVVRFYEDCVVKDVA
jgi:hypothetical protein